MDRSTLQQLSNFQNSWPSRFWVDRSEIVSFGRFFDRKKTRQLKQGKALQGRPLATLRIQSPKLRIVMEHNYECWGGDWITQISCNGYGVGTPMNRVELTPMKPMCLRPFLGAKDARILLVMGRCPRSCNSKKHLEKAPCFKRKVHVPSIIFSGQFLNF